MDVVFQPYYHWKGHFKQYADSLNRLDNELVTSESVLNFSGFISYVVLRFYLYILALNRLRKILKSSKVNNVFFVEIEPLAIFLFLPWLGKIPRAIFTIHAVRPTKYNARIKNNIAGLQRLLFFYVLRKLSKNTSVSFIVHSKVHKLELQNVIGDTAKVGVVEYPSPLPVHIPRNRKLGLGFVIFGAMRQDKGIFEFINHLIQHKDCLDGFKFYFLGKVYDERIKDIKLIDAIELKDCFITEEQLRIYVAMSDYFLLPYAKNYTGGAGPLKDATSYGKPVFTSNIPLFREVADGFGFSVVFDSIADFVSKARNMTEEQYSKLESNSKRFSETNNWNALRDNYESALLR
ncbi:glycosyltransferase [Vibrio diabolicus]|uniref:glycosyltransferase n=1 Tax=Vibrio diabolicus TaxID=50719 RepID=UPI00294108C1|nr:glycosyltransferase [Vibrio diabolicus]MDV5037618.1 glycosyltransferase [Vibrio diabolicus]